jgi:serine/threonine protein kinase
MAGIGGGAATRSRSEGSAAFVPVVLPLGPQLFPPIFEGLPSIEFQAVLKLETAVCDADATVFMCPSSGNAYALGNKLADTQFGKVYSAARLLDTTPDGSTTQQWGYVFPYEFVAIKQESKERVRAMQVRMSKGIEGDNSILDKEITVQMLGTHVADVVPQLYECWHDAENLYSVWEFFPCELRSRIVRGPNGGDSSSSSSPLSTHISPSSPHPGSLSEGITREFMLDVTASLACLHELGWCHRDISPENIMIRREAWSGEEWRGGQEVDATRERAVLIDFGTARPLIPATPVASPRSAFEEAPYVPHTLNGFQPLPPPPPEGAFCKPAYADPLYILRRTYFGIAYDLWSLAQTMYACVEGGELYSSCHPADKPFEVVVAAEEYAFAGGATPRSGAGDAAGGGVNPLFALLSRVSARREKRGLPPLSDAFVDLLLRLFRIRPAFRPHNIATVLSHPWFRGTGSPWGSVLPLSSPLPSPDLSSLSLTSKRSDACDES